MRRNNVKKSTTPRTLLSRRHAQISTLISQPPIDSPAKTGDIHVTEDGSERLGSPHYGCERFACMSVFDCLFTCVVYAYELLPKIGQSFHAPLRLASSCGMAAAAVAAEGPEDCGRSTGGAQGAVTGDGEPEEAEEFTCPAYCSELSRRQNEQRKTGLFCDVTLVFHTGGAPEERIHTFTAHRSVLSAASHYFTLLLGGQFSESVSGRVELKEWSTETGPDPETVSSVIQFMYTGEIRVTSANVHEVLELADRWIYLTISLWEVNSCHTGLCVRWKTSRTLSRPTLYLHHDYVSRCDLNSSEHTCGTSYSN